MGFFSFPKMMKTKYNSKWYIQNINLLFKPKTIDDNVINKVVCG